MPSPYATDEPPSALWFEQVNNASVFIGAIAYGMHIITFFTCTYYLYQEKKISNWRWFSFIFVMFGAGTANICFNVHFNELAWIDERNYPGGPLAFLFEQQSIPMNTAGNSVSTLTAFLAQILLIYRVHVLWRRWYILVLPVLMLLACTTLGVFVIIQAALPQSSLFADATVDFGIPYFSLSMSLNIILTLLLVSRLFYVRYKIVRTLGNEYGKMYTGVATMILESGLPYGVFSFIFIILYGIQNTASLLFIPLLAQIECITPQIIILRVSRGRAWTNDTISDANLSKLRFGRPAPNSGGPAGGAPGSSGYGRETSDLGAITFRVGEANSQNRNKGTLTIDSTV